MIVIRAPEGSLAEGLQNWAFGDPGSNLGFFSVRRLSALKYISESSTLVPILLLLLVVVAGRMYPRPELSVELRITLLSCRKDDRHGSSA